MLIGIDIGYGDVKCAYEKDNEIKTFKFPTAVERVRGTGFNFAKEDENVLSFNGFKYRVGEDVLLTPYDTRNVDFLIEFAPLFVYKAMKKIEEIEKIKLEKSNKVATGLSILNWHKNEEFSNSLEKFVVNDEVFTNEVFLFAQGQGVYIQNKDILNLKGLVVIVDIGFNTLDVITFKDEKPLKDLSFAVEFGTFLIIKELQKLIENEYKTTISEIEAKEIFNSGEVKLFGKIRSFKNEISKLKEMYSKELIMTLKNKNVELFRNADYVVMSGGGVYYLDKNMFYDNVVFSENPYEYGNVKGYLKGVKNG